jgi:hypothetical protein
MAPADSSCFATLSFAAFQLKNISCCEAAVRAEMCRSVRCHSGGFFAVADRADSGPNLLLFVRRFNHASQAPGHAVDNSHARDIPLK